MKDSITHGRKKEIVMDIKQNGYQPSEKLIYNMMEIHKTFGEPVTVSKLKEFQNQIRSDDKLNAINKAISAFQEAEEWCQSIWFKKRKNTCWVF